VRLNLERTGNGSRAIFIQKLRANRGYIRLICRQDSDPGRRERFEEFCWRSHCAALRSELKGAKAKRALRHLESLRIAIGNPSWLPQEIVESLDSLQRDLRSLAAKGRQGRPADVVGTWFRRDMHHFVPARFSRKTVLSISREEIDDILADVLPVICGRTVSEMSITRMRMRDRALNRNSDLKRRRRPRTKRSAPTWGTVS
jgi:hypothetical protein